MPHTFFCAEGVGVALLFNCGPGARTQTLLLAFKRSSIAEVQQQSSGWQILKWGTQRGAKTESGLHRLCQTLALLTGFCSRAQVLGEDLVLVAGQQDRMQRGADTWAHPVSYDKLAMRYRRWRNSIGPAEEAQALPAEGSVQMSAGELFREEDSDVEDGGAYA